MGKTAPVRSLPADRDPDCEQGMCGRRLLSGATLHADRAPTRQHSSSCALTMLNADSHVRYWDAHY